MTAADVSQSPPGDNYHERSPPTTLTSVQVAPLLPHESDAAGAGSDPVSASRRSSGPDSASPAASPAASTGSSPAAGRTPALYWLILFAALLAISCAGTLLRTLADTPPLLKSFWRLFFVAWYLGAGFAWQYWHCDGAVRARFLSLRTQLVLLATGAITALHFGCWIWSLQHTSLSHSLFFVCSHPLLVVGVMLAQGQAVTRWEAVGVGIGLAGSALMLLDDVVGSGAQSSSDSGSEDQGPKPGSADNNGAIPVSLAGDAMAFAGAIAMVGYLYAGKHCRAFLPLFLYAFPVTFIASLCMLVMSACLEDVTLAGLTAHSVFGFLGPRAILTMLLIVVGPGITGHLGIQFVLTHISPLVISIVITVEPILGALIGMAVGVEEAPHLFTLLGGPLTLAGCLLAVYGSWLRERLPPDAATDAATSSNQPTLASSGSGPHGHSSHAGGDLHGGPFSISDERDSELGLELAEMDRQMEWDEVDDAELLAFDAQQSDELQAPQADGAARVRPSVGVSPAVAPLPDKPHMQQMSIASATAAPTASFASRGSRWKRPQYQLAPLDSAVEERGGDPELDPLEGFEEDDSDAQLVYE